jgi:DNA-binding transcriptional MerR regulator
MNIQILQYADFSLDEIKDKFGFHRLENVDPAYCQEIAAFLDEKNAETRKKIAHLQKVSQLLDVASETLRDFNHERDQQLAVIVREIYQAIRKKDTEIFEEGCHGHQG